MPEEECMTRLLLAAVLATVLHVIGATAEEFPTRPITIIVPFPAGGPSDTLARILADRMRVPLRQPVVIENVTGAGASIGAIRGAQAPADGYTLSIGNWTSHVGSGAMYRLPFDLLTDLAPISLLTTAPLMIVGKNAIPATNGIELLAWLKKNSDRVAMATVGAGSAAHVCSIYLQNNIGTHMQFVPYRGGAPVMQDLVAGQIDLFCAEASQTLSYIRGGQMKAFMVMAKDRWPAAPDVQTVDEAGARGLYISFWHGLWVPKGTPQDVIAKLNAAVVETLGDASVHKRLTDLGLVVATREQQTPQALAAHHKAELEKWWPIMKAANIKAEAN
jgi:tripartite-type tricarboxylate transporter receptor subunit TctC